MNAVPCSLCKEAGHHTNRCPELYAPLKSGFFAPSGGGGHSHDDDDDEKLNVSLVCQTAKCPTLATPFPLKKPSV
jgi:hypothetical protein